MSNPIRDAIDNSLSSLRVSNRDVESIMDRIRADGRQRRPSKVRSGLVLAMVLLLVTVSGTAAMLLSPRDLVNDQVIPMAQGLEDNMLLNESQVRQVLALAEANGIKLNQEALERIEGVLKTYGGYWTYELIEDIMGVEYGDFSQWPEDVRQWYYDAMRSLWDSRGDDVRWRDPVEGEMTEAEAIGMAKAYILSVEPSAPLNDPAKYEVSASFNDGVSLGDYPGYYWNVFFRALDRYVTEYNIDISPTGNAFYRCLIQRGAGEGHTAQEIYAGVMREFNAPMAQWTQEQLRDYGDELRQATAESVKTIDRLFLATEYPDIAEDAIPSDQAAVMALKHLGKTAGKDCRVEAVMYIGSTPRPMWKVSVYEYNELEGYGDRWMHFVELDSVTGEVQYTEMQRYEGMRDYMYFPHTAYGGVLPVAPEYVRPMPSVEVAQFSAASYIQQHFGEARNVNDTALFKFTCQRPGVYTGVTMRLSYQSVDSSKPSYWVWIDGFGDVIDAGVDAENTLDGIRNAMKTQINFTDSYMKDLQNEVRIKVDLQSDPLARAFVQTNYVWDVWELDEIEKVDEIIDNYLGLWADHSWAANLTGLWVINTNPHPIIKAAVESTKGNFLLEIDGVTYEVLEAIRVEDLDNPWYLRYILFFDLRSIGLDVKSYTPPENDGKVVDEGVMRGMDIIVIYDRFRDLYGRDPADWSQAQLRSFQAALAESWSIYTELSIPCILATEYPDIPDGAIPKEDAAVRGAAALGIENYVVEGGVVLGSDPNPVWKISYSVGSSYYVAEIDCRTGEVTATGVYRFEEMNLNSYWFEGIVLEETIDEERPKFTYEGNG